MSDKHIKMKREDAAKWLTALRSGDYSQGINRLHTINGYCCLGVLQMALDGQVEHINTADDQPKLACLLPTNAWLTKHGITFLDSKHEMDNAPFLTAFGCDASTANDLKGYGFKLIADAIEADLEFTD